MSLFQFLKERIDFKLFTDARYFEKEILFSSLHLPKSPPEGDGPLGRSSPSEV